MQFNFGNFLVTKFKTPAGLVSFLRAFDAPTPSDEMARKWFQRSSVPAEWFAVLLAYLELDEGAAISLRPWLQE